MSFGDTFKSLVPESSDYTIDMATVGEVIETTPVLKAQAAALKGLGTPKWGLTSDWDREGEQGDAGEEQEREELQYLREQEQEREQERVRGRALEEDLPLNMEDWDEDDQDGDLEADDQDGEDLEREPSVISDEEDEDGLSPVYCDRESLKQEFSDGVVTSLEEEAAKKKAAAIVKTSRVPPKEETSAAQQVSRGFMARIKAKGSVDDSSLKKRVVTSATDKIPTQYRAQAEKHLKGLSADMQSVWADGFLQGMIAARSKELEKAAGEIRVDSKDIRKALAENANALKTATGMLEQFKIWMDRESRARAKTSAAAGKPPSVEEEEVVKNGNLLYKVRGGVPVEDSFLPASPRAFWVSLADWVGTGSKAAAKAIVVAETDLGRVPSKYERLDWKDCLKVKEVQRLHTPGAPQGTKSTEAYYKKVFDYWSKRTD